MKSVYGFKIVSWKANEADDGMYNIVHLSDINTKSDTRWSFNPSKLDLLLLYTVHWNVKPDLGL